VKILAGGFNRALDAVAAYRLFDETGGIFEPLWNFRTNIPLPQE